LSSPTNATLADGQGLGTITNDDSRPTISISGSPSQLEGDAGSATDALFTVSLSNASDEVISVRLDTADGTATAASGDYDAVSNRILTFNPGDPLTQQTAVRSTGDAIDESNETFTVGLTNAVNGSLGVSTATGTIIDDDGAPSLLVDDVSLTEGNSGAKQFAFTVTLVGAIAQPVTVQVASQDGSATDADNDYEPLALQTLTFNVAGPATQQVILQVNGDSKFEVDQTFAVTLSNATNATIDDGTGLGTILNDDARPTISINDRSAAETNGSFFDLSVSISLSNPTDEAVTVRVDTADGTATTADNDYLAVVNRFVTFSPGVTVQQTAVRVNGDTQFEPDETFFVNLSAATNASSIADNQGQGTITNDDSPPPVNQPPVIVTSGGGNTAAVTVSENTTAVVDVEATDPDVPPQSLTFSIAAGADATRFSINGTSGVLSFASPPNFESPADVSGDNVYDVVVRVSDGNLSDTQTIAVSVTNVNEAPTLNPIASPAAILAGAGQQTINLSGISAGLGESQTLTVTATSSNPSLIPDPTVNYASPNATGSLSYTPVADQTGTAVITVTVRDNGGTANGGVDAITRTFTVTVLPDNSSGFDLSIPNRALIVADPANPGNKVLLAIGGGGGDALIMEPRPRNNVQIRVRQTGRLLGIFPSSAFGRIVVFGMAGNDTIVIDARITKSVELHGGSGDDYLFGGAGRDSLFGEDGNDRLYGGKGNDKLFGGSGSDSLYGGAGNDALQGEFGNDSLFGEAGHDLLLGGFGDDGLFGGSGRDILIGDRGADRLLGQNDDDVLVGGATIYENNDAALGAILAEWTSRRPFGARVNSMAALLNPSSVIDDGARDELRGEGGRDWLLDFALSDSIVGFNGRLTTGDRKN
jgi:Ca2+-binding RTX toxin-like protein